MQPIELMESSHTIVIADDHPLFRNALLQSINVAIEDAKLLEADCLDSLFGLLKEQQEPDLVLLDLKMPGTNGLSGLMQLRSDYPSLPVVVVSANEEPSVIAQVKAQGAFGFIPKSSDCQALMKAIDQILDGEPYFPEAASSYQAKHAELSERITALTPQQYKVLTMLSDGLLNKQIAYDLNVSEATIKAHMTAIFRKLGVKNRTQAVILLQQLESVQ